MTSVAQQRALAGGTITPWQQHGIALAIAAAGILLLFRADATRLATMWWSSGAYGHCLLIPPLVAWLVWTRRALLARLDPVAWWPGLALVVIGGTGWLMGDAGGVTFARQWGLVLMLQGAVVTILGAQVARGLAFPLAYASFAVPVGASLEPLLQRATVALVMPLLAVAGIPAGVDGVMIHAGPYLFEVAEACSGAKFVLAMIAFSTLVAHLCFTSWRRRAAFMAASIVVPILANGVRAFATIYAAQVTSIGIATGFDHIVFGWIFFALVMAMLLALGWRWFDRQPSAAAFDPAQVPPTRGGRLGLVAATALVLGTAAVFAGWSAATAGVDAALPARIQLPSIAGWHRVPIERARPWQPWYPGADHFLFGRYADAAGEEVDLAIAVYGRQREGAKLGAFGTGVLREDGPWLRVADLPPIAGGEAVRIAAPGPIGRVVASWYRVGDVLSGDLRAVKLATMRARVFGHSQTAVALHLSAVSRPKHDPRRAIEHMVASLGPLAILADRAAGLASARDDSADPAIEQIRP
ncbi:exosortase A [Sphingomonas sp. Tas61C01]|uniref:exosortase A n=1 Tax=Sphingomonas sp. Tas61C01 TaxID=3458297 RepID=UPI00403E6830